MKIFNQVQGKKWKRNKFDLSHERKMSIKQGKLYPFFVQEVLPFDTFKVNSEMLLRLQPLIAPIMHRVRIKTDFFFVPNRLVWDNWQKFITGGDKGTDSPSHPYLNFVQAHVDAGYLEKGSLADYLGLPNIERGENLASEYKVNALPFRAYQLIYNEFYRDQNLIDPIPFSKGDGSEVIGENVIIRTRAWEKDYFTSALPWAQKGGAIESPVTGRATSNTLRSGDIVKSNDQSLASGDLTTSLGVLKAGTDDAQMKVIGDSIIEAGFNINDLRVAVRLQEWLERQARAGSRYIETILSNFGILSSDARLQRPEYLGGAVNPIVISEVLSTYQNADDTGYPQGTMSGHGVSAGTYGGFKKTFEEHGFVIGIMTVLPKTAYQQGIDKQWTRFDKFDYAWPSFAQLGEQEIKSKELYFDRAVQAHNEETFGYQSRYAEYKYKPSTVHGDFRKNLAFWHMGRIFETKPVLNKSFIEADPTKRVFAVQSEEEDEILCQIYHSVDAIRVLPYFNTPTL